MDFGQLVDLFPLARYSFPGFSIKALTGSRIQFVMVMALSIIAFVFGMVTIVTGWKIPSQRCAFVHVK